MNRTRMIVLAVVALILSAGVTYLAYRLMAPGLRTGQEMSQIVVTVDKLAPGSRITEKDVRLAAWPKGTEPAGSFQDVASVMGRGIVVQMFANEPVLESKLAPKEAGAGLTVAIPDGMRAVSIQVNDVIGVAGFVQPGTRVDLILTGTPKPHEETAAKIILENLQVLAAGQNVQQDVNGKPQTVQVVTLLVNPEQAAKIALATGDGSIRLALRNPLDLKEVNPPMVPRSVLYSGERLVAEKPVPVKAVPVSAKTGARKVVTAVPLPPPAPPPKVMTVELIMGPTKTTATFQEKQSEAPKP